MPCEGGVVVPVPLLEQLGGQHSGRRAEGRLGEVHDAAGPVDQHEPDGREACQRSKHDPLQDDTGR